MPISNIVVEEIRSIAAENPEFKLRMRIEEIFLNWFLHLKKSGANALDPMRLHEAAAFFLFHLSMTPIEVDEFMFFRDCVSGRYDELDDLLVGYVGTVFYLISSKRRDEVFHFYSNTERMIVRHTRAHLLLAHEVPWVESASKFATDAYKHRLSIDTVLAKAHLR